MKTVNTPSPGNPSKRVKVNLFANDNPEELEIIRHRFQDLDKKPLRIDERTVVMVKPEQCTPEYAEKLRAKFEKIKNLFR